MQLYVRLDLRDDKDDFTLVIRGNAQIYQCGHQDPLEKTSIFTISKIGN